MKRNLFMPLAATLLLLAGCDYNKDNFEGLDEASRPANVFSKEYTLLDADYAAISTNSKNKDKAKAAGKSSELAALATNKYFTSTLTAQDYIPAYLAALYYTADENSAIKVTYQDRLDAPEYLTKLNASKTYTLAAADYQAAWGSGSTLNFFTPAQPAGTYLPAILLAKVATPAAGDIECATYNYSTAEPAPVTYAFKEDFESGASGTNIESDNWANITVTGEFLWKTGSYSGNLFATQTAFKHTAGKLDSYLISKEFTIVNGMSLELDAAYLYSVAAGGSITVLLSSNLTETTPAGIAAATWTDLTANFNPPSSTSTVDIAPCGSASLSAYAGNKIRIAIRYQGDLSTGATTTVRIDNVSIKTPGKNSYTAYNALYTYDGTAWAPYTANNALIMSKVDFAEFGINYDNFSGVQADSYLPLYLKQKYPYALEGDVKVPVYKFFLSSNTSIRADKYEFINGQFVKDTSIETTTSQFVLKGGQWKFDPSTIVNVPVIKKDPVSTPFYTAIINAVKVANPSYVTSFGDGEYYYGASYYNNNFDFRPSAWRGQLASAYASYSDAELIKLMYERLPEAIQIALKKLYADAKPVEGITVIYTVNFGIYDGANSSWTIQFEVTALGAFTYIKDSLKKVE